MSISSVQFRKPMVSEYEVLCKAIDGCMPDCRSAIITVLCLGVLTAVAVLFDNNVFLAIVCLAYLVGLFYVGSVYLVYCRAAFKQKAFKNDEIRVVEAVCKHVTESSAHMDSDGKKHMSDSVYTFETQYNDICRFSDVWTVGIIYQDGRYLVVDFGRDMYGLIELKSR